MKKIKKYMDYITEQTIISKEEGKGKSRKRKTKMLCPYCDGAGYIKDPKTGKSSQCSDCKGKGQL